MVTHTDCSSKCSGKKEESARSGGRQEVSRRSEFVESCTPGHGASLLLDLVQRIFSCKSVDSTDKSKN